MSAAIGQPRFLLVYGSQTGQSKAVAEEIFEKSEKLGFHADLNCLSGYGKKFTLETESVAVIVTSSTGDGEPPDTARKFYRAIHSKSLSPNHLSSLRYALLGLGDSNYTSCWNCPKTIDKRLQDLGARPFYPSGYADDATGLELVVEPWVSGLLVALTTVVGCARVDALVSIGAAAVAEQQSSNANAGATLASHKELAVIASPSTVATSLEELELGSKTCADKAQLLVAAPPASPVSRVSNSSSNGLNGVVDGTATTTGANMMRQTASSTVVSTRTSDDPDDSEQRAIRLRTLLFTGPVVLTLPSKPERFLCLSSVDSTHSSRDDDVRWHKAKASSPDTMQVSVLRADVLTGLAAAKKTLLLRLDLADSGILYEPGDSFGVHCENDAEEVQWLLDRLNVPHDEADRPLVVAVMPTCSRKLARVPDHLAVSASLRQLFTYCLDIRAVPKKTLLCLAADFASDSDERQRLQELSSREGASDYTEVVLSAEISFLDVLACFPSCRLPVEILLENIPQLQPRAYSAASSQLNDKTMVDIVFNIMHVRPFQGRRRTGLCTGMLNRLTAGLQLEQPRTSELPKVLLFPRKNKNFRLPVNLELPVVMICAGTGIAPFVGFLEHRYRQLSASPNKHVGKLWLFYGCRLADSDLLFRNVLIDMLQRGVLAKCVVCLSQQTRKMTSEQNGGDADVRELQPASQHTDSDSTCAGTAQDVFADSSSKSAAAGVTDDPAGGLVPLIHFVNGYVQHGVTSEAQALGSLLWTEDAHLYVCGSSAMAKGVLAAMTDVTALTKGVSLTEASNMIKELRLKKKYMEDVWS